MDTTSHAMTPSSRLLRESRRGGIWMRDPWSNTPFGMQPRKRKTMQLYVWPDRFAAKVYRSVPPLPKHGS
eukprot:scaffold242991_cov35-Attheya_sp.AAC.1